MRRVLVALWALLAVASAGAPTAVDNLRNQLFELELVLWKNISSPEWNAAGFDRIAALRKSIAAFDERVQAMSKPPRSIQHTRWLGLNIGLQMNTIEKGYKKFLEFTARDFSVKELTTLISSVAKVEDTIESLLGYGNFFLDILKEKTIDLCKLQTSEHQLVYDLYNTVALSEIKGYATMQFSWMLLRVYDKEEPKGNFIAEVDLTRRKFVERTKNIADAAVEALAKTQRDLYRCDPPQHKIGQTYEEVTRFLQGYVENELDMHPNQTCSYDCPYNSYTKSYGCYRHLFCDKQSRCKGRIINCEFIESDMTICMADRLNPRRYEWIQYKSGKTFGRNTFGRCKNRVTVKSWMRSNLQCSYCFCLCEDHIESSERFFSLREALADTGSNRVVTGLRLVKYGRIFHLQISEGTLGERGSITPGGWVPIQWFYVTERGVERGVDYHALTYEKRAIDLDELNSPHGHVLTGVRFRVVRSHLQFQIQSTPFDYDTGALAPALSKWTGYEDSQRAGEPRSRLELDRPDIPTRCESPLPVDSQSGQYVEFVNSDMQADAAQSTVPFVDVQPLQPAPGAALLGGAGVLHRGARGCGGWLAVKLRTYDHSLHVKPRPPPGVADEAEPSRLDE